MAQLDRVEKERNIAQKDFDKVSPILIDLMNLSPKNGSNNGQNSGFVLEDFEKFLTKLITQDVLPTKKERFTVINFLYKIQARREAIAISSGELDIEEIKKASESLGRKMATPQSEPFGTAII